MPSAPGMAGIWYQTFLSFDEERAVQKAALALHRKGLIVDPKGKRVRLRRDMDGKRYVPRYTLAKFAMLSLVNGVGRGEVLSKGSRRKVKDGRKNA